MKYRIALVGNMNNSLFAITRYLRDMGYDARLFYRVGMEHFQPKADTFSLDYLDYCFEVDWLNNGFYNIDADKIRKDLDGFDFYIGQGDEAAAAYFAGFTMDVYYPYGSDVYKYAYLPAEFTPLQKLKSLLGWNRVSYAQMKNGTAAKYMRAAIVNAKHLLAEYTNEDFERKLKGLDPKGNYEYATIPMFYHKEYERITELLPDVHWGSVVRKLREENDFIVLYHGRQEWKTVHNEFTGKNTHHLIMGFAEYVKANPTVKSILIMLEYGSDTAYSKQLIEELGISQYVKWFPKMYRKDLMYLISATDVCTGEFGRSYLTFGTVVEAMLMKKPVIHYREDDLYSHYPALYPMLHAKEPQEIAEALAWAAGNGDTLKTMGLEAYNWTMQNVINAPLVLLENIIEKKRKGTA